MGNIVNRVFDSSGPEGKVRGTPQQIIDKYNQLARDAQLGNDRVAAENFQQHAEHYARLLGEAQREQDARREQQEAQQNRDQRSDDEQPQQPPPQSQPNASRQEPAQPSDDAPRRGNGSADVIDIPDDGSESTLVDTPEDKPAPKPRRPRKPRAPKASDGGSEGGEQPDMGDQSSAPAAE
jgi:hypothetical protein